MSGEPIDQSLNADHQPASTPRNQDSTKTFEQITTEAKAISSATLSDLEKAHSSDEMLDNEYRLAPDSGSIDAPADPIIERSIESREELVEELVEKLESPPHIEPTEGELLHELLELMEPSYETQMRSGDGPLSEPREHSALDQTQGFIKDLVQDHSSDLARGQAQGQARDQARDQAQLAQISGDFTTNTQREEESQPLGHEAPYFESVSGAYPVLEVPVTVELSREEIDQMALDLPGNPERNERAHMQTHTQGATPELEVNYTPTLNLYPPRPARGVWTLISLLGLIYLSLTQGDALVSGLSVRDGLRYGANFLPLVVGEPHQWWRLLSYSLLHWNIFHLLFNLIVLYLIGREVERLIGALNLIFVFIYSATLAGLMTLFFYTEEISLGASGGIYGLMGAFISLWFTTRGEKLRKASRRVKWYSLIFLGSFVLSYNSPWVDHASHLGGLFSGAFVVLFFAPTYGIKSLTTKHRWALRGSGFLFTCSAVALTLPLTPRPHPIFKLMRDYHKHAPQLRSYDQRIRASSPLEHRVLWEQQASPLLDLMQGELTTVSKVTTLDRSELKTLSEASQWSLWCLLEGWRSRLGAPFFTHPQRNTCSRLPPYIATIIYDQVLSEQRVGLMLDPHWDERVAAIEHFSLWSHLPDARQKLSVLSLALVEEANSISVRERGSLWGDSGVREARFRSIEEILQRLQSSSTFDVLTLTLIAWVRGDMELVMKRSRAHLLSLNQVRSHQSQRESRAHQRLTDLWIRALKTNLTTLSGKLKIEQIAPHELKVEGLLYRSSQVILSALSCDQDEVELPTQVESSHRLEWLIELVVPHATSTPILPEDPQIGRVDNELVRRPHRLEHTFSYQGHLPDQLSCLKSIKVLGWRLSHHTDPTQRAIWRAYPRAR